MTHDTLHRAPITDCCWSGDGVYLATASSDRSVVVVVVMSMVMIVVMVVVVVVVMMIIAVQVYCCNQITRTQDYVTGLCVRARVCARACAHVTIGTGSIVAGS